MYEKASWASYLDQEGAMSKLRMIRMMTAARNSWYDKMLQRHNKMLKQSILAEIPEEKRIDPQLERILKFMEEQKLIDDQFSRAAIGACSAEENQAVLQVALRRCSTSSKL